MAYTVKICPIGDSLTEGDGNGSAYRYELFRMLYGEGVDFAMVGHRRTGDTRLPDRYAAHSAYCGYVIGDDELHPYHSIRRGIVQDGGDQAIKQADIILLFIGTNDIHQKIDLEHIGDRFERLLDTIYELNPSVTVYAGLHYSRYHHAEDSDWWLLPKYLLSINTADYRAKNGRDLRIVDLGGGQHRLAEYFGDQPIDDGHPSLAGNRKLAASWAQAILPQIRELNAKEGETLSTIHVTGLDSQMPDSLSLRPCQSVTLRASALPDNATVPNVQWYSSHSNVATVDDYGIVHAIRPGTTRIFAVTMDGNFHASTTVYVSGTPITLCDGMNLLYENNFSDAGTWSGDTNNIIRTDLREFYAYWRNQDGCITANSAIQVHRRMLLEFTHMTAISQNPENLHAAMYTQVALDDVAIRFCISDRTIQLVQNDVVLAQFEQNPRIAAHATYSLLIDGEKATLYRENEVLLTAIISPFSKELQLSIKWQHSSIPDRLYDIRVYGTNT